MFYRVITHLRDKHMSTTEKSNSISYSTAQLRVAIASAKLTKESTAVAALLAAAPYTDAVGEEISQHGARLVEIARADPAFAMLDTFLAEYGLSNKEGVALMCLSEALLRIPDHGTAELLIADRVQLGDWISHVGSAESTLVNASTWGLVLTGNVISVGREFTAQPKKWFQQLINRISEPVVFAAMRASMKILGREFVLGTTIDNALKNSDTGGLYSYDMLGEAARDAGTAGRYLTAFQAALVAIGGSDKLSGVPTSISIKLSALHPRYEFSQQDRVVSELVPILKQLFLSAAEHNIGVTIDAEEADRLDISLEVFETLARDPELAGQQHLGFVVQALSKRAPLVLDWLVALGRETGRTIPVRLVKGAYWDAEIKHAQVAGLSGYSVFTRKPSTDLSFLVCARKMLDHPDEIYGQFATHNAHSVAAVMAMATATQKFEFQRLHGMSESLFRAADTYYDNFPSVRVYAPVGHHDDLLAYLVRRLLENGSNSSFINRFLDAQSPAEELVRDPVVLVRETKPVAHPGICLPSEIYGAQRQNSAGVDLTDALSIESLTSAVSQSTTVFKAASILCVDAPAGSDTSILNPARHGDVVGTATMMTEPPLDQAFLSASNAQYDWDLLGGNQRADILLAFSNALEGERNRFVALLCREAGKTYADAIAEVREAVDFSRYYAAQARNSFEDPQVMPGPTGESNELSLHGRGVFVCISPWNFPLAIFVGQVTAALAAGNCVIAKPASETPLVAFAATQLLHKSGVPRAVCQLMLGSGELGDLLVKHDSTAGVVFTGSMPTAQKINLAMAQRTGPIAQLIAETGGQNAMVIDSSALLEQVTDDVIQSAFVSTGQRCSALRVLYLQEDIADAAITMIKGAMDELSIGDPALLATDVGPVISAAAVSSLQDHIQSLTDSNQLLHSISLPSATADGTFVAPTMFEISHIDDLAEEYFGPILHVIRFAAERFEEVLMEVANCGYSLTFGIHSRIESRIQYATKLASAGNIYANRNITGAVVGTQPFGGQHLSGTGPKAGGPHYLYRFATERVVSINTVATGGNADLLTLDPDAD
ncbi:MAG: RHH-type proline utilization regulon transcriptional repressor/proline dehydrogenase [Cyclobacteriaceae bacterium]|jgi:RHH-type proline utilization regulon transcriptional repressor/proline dehydrogenase/delta 1-pyrroline-5-carboxylate dehydrogenase